MRSSRSLAVLAGPLLLLAALGVSRHGHAKAHGTCDCNGVAEVSDDSFIPDALLVTMKSDVRIEKDADAIAASVGWTRSSDVFRDIRLAVLTKKDATPQDVRTASKTICDNLSNIVECVEPDLRIGVEEVDRSRTPRPRADGECPSPTPPPNDPKFKEQWAIAKIELQKGWAVSQGSTDVRVAVIDGGIETGHPDLRENVTIPEKDFTNATPDQTLREHGTAMAGLIGASVNNGYCVAGTNWHVSIGSLRALNGVSSPGSGLKLAIEAIEYSKKPDDGTPFNLINASWSLKQSPHGGPVALRNAIQQAGVLFVTAAADGNLDTGPKYPCSYTRSASGKPALQNVLCVTATQCDDQIVSGAGHGPETVDMGVPGEDVYTTILDGECTARSESSVAAAQATGVAALVLAHCGSESGAELKQLILRGAEHVAPLDSQVRMGKRLNAKGALEQNCKGGKNP